MENKLSDAYLNLKSYNDGTIHHALGENIVMDIEDVKVYGNLIAIEAVATSYYGTNLDQAEYYKKIAQEHGITDFKL